MTEANVSLGTQGEIPPERLRRCADSALNAHGTAYIFEKKALGVRRKLNVLTFLGIAGPATVGAIFMSYQVDGQIQECLLNLASAVAVVQLLGSVWALSTNWSSDLSYYLESKSSNYSLSARYDSLRTDDFDDAKAFEAELKLLDKEAEIRADQDNKHDVTEKERRMGMRYGLRKYQRACAGCGTVPMSMTPTNCDVCGNF